MIKKLLTKEPNQTPENRFLISIIQAFCQANLHKYKQSENHIQSALKSFLEEDVLFFNKYQLLVTIALTTSYNDDLLVKMLDKLQKSQKEVNLLKN
jgi:hypothetical protein